MKENPKFYSIFEVSFRLFLEIGSIFLIIIYKSLYVKYMNNEFRYIILNHIISCYVTLYYTYIQYILLYYNFVCMNHNNYQQCLCFMIKFPFFTHQYRFLHHLRLNFKMEFPFFVFININSFIIYDINSKYTNISYFRIHSKNK